MEIWYIITKEGVTVLNRVGKIVTAYGKNLFDPTIKQILKDAGVVK